MNITIQKRIKCLLQGFLTLLLGVLVLLWPFQVPKIYASNSFMEFQDFFIDTDGYYKVKTKFLQNMTLCWQHEWPSGYLGDHAWSYGDASWGYHFRTDGTSWGGSYYTLVPDLPSNLTWLDSEGSHCENYITNQVIDFTIAKEEVGSGVRAFKVGDDTTILDHTDITLTTDDWNKYYGSAFTTDSASYYYTHSDYVEGSTLFITYPVANTTNIISPPLVITGTFTNSQDFDFIYAELYDDDDNRLGGLFQYVGNNATGTLDATYMTWRSGFSAGDYTLKVGFTTDWSTRAGEQTFTLRAVSEISPLLPSGETPPPVYSGSDPEIYYTDKSNYTTSTPLYDALSGAMYPVIGSIGENLSYFSNRFLLSQAQETGSNLGNAILVARGYSSNINQLLGSLPVAESLVFYIILLILVSVFRLIKNLINMIKP